MNRSSFALHPIFISRRYALPMDQPMKGVFMDANWLIFGGTILGLVVAAVFVYKKGQQS